MYPTLFQIGNFEVSMFGVMLLVGFIVGGELMARSFAMFRLEKDAAWRLVTWCAIGGILGAKGYYVIESLARDPNAQAMALILSRGGLTWYGGLIGGTGAALIASRIIPLPALQMCNLASPSLAAGQALGRIGCLLVGDDYGKRTEVAWGIELPQGLPPTIDATGQVFAVHPTMVYETLWLGVGALWLWRRRGSSPFLFGEYLILAGTGRLWIELFRVNPNLIGPLSNAQIVALVCIAIGVGGLTLMARRKTSERSA